MYIYHDDQKHNRRLSIWVSVILIAGILSACANPTGMQTDTTFGGQAGAQTERLSGNTRPELQLEITADSGAMGSNQAGGGVDEGSINTEGTVVAPGAAADGQGLVTIGGGGATGDSVSSKDVEWRTYIDAKYGFSLQVPDIYVILPKSKSAGNVGQQPLYAVRFQTEALASGETAELEPPQFAIEIYERPASISLRDWIQANHFAPQSAEYESFELAGAQEGLKVSLKVMLAPNVFYYFATEKLIFRIIPLGEYSQEMLASFKLPVE